MSIYDSIIENGIRKKPDQAALLLADLAEKLGPERDELLDELLDLPLSKEAQSLVVKAVLKCRLSVRQRVRILNFLLQKDIVPDMVPALTDALIRGELDTESQIALMEYLLSLPTPPETASVLTDALMREELDADQRLALIEHLLRQPVSHEAVSVLTDALIRGKPLKDQRIAMLQYLLNQPVPAEVLPAMAAVLADKKLEKEQRSALLENLLKQPVPAEVLPAMATVMASAKLGKEQRAMLLDSLLGRGVPHEKIPALTNALIQGRPEKAQREMLLPYLLSCPMNQQQILLAFKGLMEQIGDKRLPEVDAMVLRLCEYRETIGQLCKWVDPERPTWKEGQSRALYRVVVDGEALETVFLDMLCEGNLCYLTDACIEFIDRKQLWLMIQEILLTEKYYCEFDSDEPYIFDCGVNIGLAIYYIKHRYPKARIVGFEPWNMAYECAIRNVERNHWDNVTIHHAALGPETGVMQLVPAKGNSLTSTLTNRMDNYIADKELEKILEDVQQVQLSQYIDRPVDLLKMDIEGMEGQVLRECAEALRYIKWFFCEYHYGTQWEDNSLAEILTRIENMGFDFSFPKSCACAHVPHKRPFSYIGQRTSELIWAKRRSSI